MLASYLDCWMIQGHLMEIPGTVVVDDGILLRHFQIHANNIRHFSALLTQPIKGCKSEVKEKCLEMFLKFHFEPT